MLVLTMGTFDIIHYGHFNFLKRCKELAGDGLVIVGLNTDDFVLRYRKVPAVMSYKHREKNLQMLPWVDSVVPNDQPNGSCRSLVEQFHPDLIVISTDWSPWGPKKKDYLQQLGIDQEFLDENNIILAFIPHTKGISSTEIKAHARS